MNNIFVYIENEGGKAAEVCLELMTKGRELATTLGVKLEAVVLGENLAGIEHELAKYGADTVWIADDKVFAPFRTLPHTAVMCGLIEQEKPQIVLFGATCNGRDFAPRVSSALYSGLTADCTQLVIGAHKDAKSGREYKDLLYQIRPAFGGNIIATIVNPDNRPQMATVREGVMRREYAAKPGAGEVKKIQWQKFVKDADLAVKIIDREIAESKIDIKGAGVIVAGGYGMGSKENFKLVHELAEVLGFKHICTLTVQEHDRMIGYVSQLCHAIAVSLMCANDNTSLCEYTGDSFRDLTRIARINDKMWAALFLWNKDNLISEIDMFSDALATMRQKLVDDDREGLEKMFRLSTERRKAFEKK